MGKIDLHIHTNCSDGVFSVKEVLEMAGNNSYTPISITDHDTIEAYDTAFPIAQAMGIELIPGVEISSEYKTRDVHILAYNFDLENKTFRKLLHKIYKGRFVRAKKIIKKLANSGFNVNLKEIKKVAGDSNLIGRPHIARVLMEKGYFKHPQIIFDKYLGEEGKAFVPKLTFTTEKVIKKIQEAGGVAVLAHPHLLKDDKMVKEIIEMGIDGLEVFYYKCTEQEKERYNNLALQHGLIRTGGSDFHGFMKDDALQNFSAPPLVLAELNKMKRSKQDE
ncbi:MAG: 3,5-nucleoside bisphosphate phosphatase [Candidatus Cloacimonadota bacterium]|nr:3,5-nucleoside bisphosphate phosphatase [Candidatus Cloacimonadota bacterium]